MEKAEQCPSDQVLSQLMNGILAEPELTGFSSHLELCELCQSKVRGMRFEDTLVGSLRGEQTNLERLNGTLPDLLIQSLKQIPLVDSGVRLTPVDQSLARVNSDNDCRSVLGPPVQADEIGRLGSYRVLKLLGRGGMGAVFLAEDPKLGRRVALKVMLPRIANIPTAHARFLREAKAAASLKNDHIVTIYQVDEIDGIPFLAMELLDGKSLEQNLRDGRKFKISELIRIARDVARGLADAHEKGLIHRDIKPDNLWLSTTVNGESRVKILDFGLASAEVDDVHLTQSGMIVGTPAYMAPEQARAEAKVDGRADLFSLGCVLYRLCTGEIPFCAETTVGTLMALALHTPPAPHRLNSQVPVKLSHLVMYLLQKDPAQRPKSAREVIELLSEIERSLDSATADAVVSSDRRTILSQSQFADLTPTSLFSTGSIGRRLSILGGLLAAAVLAIAAGVIFWSTSDGRIVLIESNDPSIQIAFADGELKVVGAYDQPIVVKPGTVDLKITKTQPDGNAFEFETNKLVVRKGDKIVLKIEVQDGEVRIVQKGVGVVDSKSLPSSAISPGLIPPTEDRFAKLIDAMRRANPGFDGAMAPTIEQGQLVGLTFKTDNVVDISPLRELRDLQLLRMEGNYSFESGISDLRPLEGLKLTKLFVSGNLRLTDLRPLKGMPLIELHTDGCPIVDLAPLSGMQLENLGLWSWNGTELSPLAGMPLTRLNIGGNGREMDLTPLTGAPLEFLCLNASKVKGLEPLKGMPLTVLLCENTLVSDLSPIREAKLKEFAGDTSRIADIGVLKGMPITAFHCDVIGPREIELLRGCKSLESINYQAAADVLREFDQERSGPSPTFVNSIGMEFVEIPKGKAWLVSKVGEDEISGLQETTFEEDFFLGKFEVTQEEWARVMGSNPSWFARKAEGQDEVKNLPDEVLKRLPVERVSWTDCQLFLKKLNELDSNPGWFYRLPTLAERQYAFRGGPMADPSEAEFAFCTTIRTNQLTDQDANVLRQRGGNRPRRVGSFPPNPLGLCDMHGNVWEWCDDAVPWREVSSRFISGGGWNDASPFCRVSDIKQPTEPWSYYDLGLRVARVPVRSRP